MCDYIRKIVGIDFDGAIRKMSSKDDILKHNMLAYKLYKNELTDLYIKHPTHEKELFKNSKDPVISYYPNIDLLSRLMNILFVNITHVDDLTIFTLIIPNNTSEEQLETLKSLYSGDTKIEFIYNNGDHFVSVLNSKMEDAFEKVKEKIKRK